MDILADIIVGIGLCALALGTIIHLRKNSKRIRSTQNVSKYLAHHLNILVIGFSAASWLVSLLTSSPLIIKAVATSALITALAWDLYDHRVLGRNASLTVMVNGTESQDGEMTVTFSVSGPALPQGGVTVTVPVEHHREVR
ncbi:hypothetical protein KSF_054510 [Reticulibacter mediterranei]|uniref:Uncharacterized protein n=1 Tax=Reticulibacter mediterranei TaxID=2778369 RepID=A0A8J3IKE2_9CHLR|nr:hypothetical protein [Reticulibacter mediterranei]GHO95403.1 hypothetical protein KSF_054510 [Reticulibacter mediterranei]